MGVVGMRQMVLMETGGCVTQPLRWVSSDEDKDDIFNKLQFENKVLEKLVRSFMFKL